jgi:hypothetical protein
VEYITTILMMESVILILTIGVCNIDSNNEKSVIMIIIVIVYNIDSNNMISNDAPNGRAYNINFNNEVSNIDCNSRTYYY